MVGFRLTRKSGTKPLTKEVSGHSLSNRLRTQKTHSSESKKSFKHTSTSATWESLEERSVKELSLENSKSTSKISHKELKQAKEHLRRIILQLQEKKQRLWQIQNKKLAEILVEVLNNNLPETLRATVIRDTEVNIYDCLELDEEYLELMDYILWYREKYIGLDNDERERKIFKRNIKGVIDFAKTQVPNWKKKANQSRHYNAYKRRETQKRKISQKNDSFKVDRGRGFLE